MIPYNLHRMIDKCVAAALERTAIAKITEVKRLSLGPADVLIVKYDGVLSADTHQRLQETVRKLFGHDRVAIATKGVDFEVACFQPDPAVPPGNRVHGEFKGKVD